MAKSWKGGNYKTTEEYILDNSDYTGGWIPGTTTQVAPGWVKKVRAADLAKRESIADIKLKEKQADILGRPRVTTTGTERFGPKPEMGEMGEFVMPERGAPPPLPEVQMGQIPTIGKAEPGELSTYQAPTRGEVGKFGMPEMGAMPEFIAPEYDEGAVGKLAQQHSAAGVRNLRSAIQMATGRRSDNPNVDRQLVKDALAGYGQGLEEVMGGARKTATAEYAQKYATEYKTAGMNWQNAVQAVRDKFAGQMTARSAEYQAEQAAVEQVYAADVSAEQQRVESENRLVLEEYAQDSDRKKQEFLAAVQQVRDEFQGNLDGRRMEYQAKLDEINQVFLAKAQAEQQRIDIENKRNMAVYDAAWKDYLSSGITTTTESYEGIS